MERVRVGIVGVGHMGNLHARILSRDERVQLVAFYDVLTDVCQARAKTFGVDAASCLDDLIERVDAVYVATPNTGHVEPVLRALQAERHVFCEKPLATSLAEARRVYDAWRSNHTVFQVGHNRRFAPVYQRVKALLDDERWRPHSAHVKMNRGELLSPPWVGDPTITGGFLYETTIHMLDLLRWFFGDAEALTVQASKHSYRECDDFSMLIRFANGLHATLASSADASWHFPFERLEVFCHHGTIESQEMDRLSYTLGLESQTLTESFDMLDREVRWGYVQEDRAFIDAILAGQGAPVSVEDGLKAVELVDACYRAARSGETVHLAAR